MEFFPEPETAQSSNWFYNAQSQQNYTHKIMGIAPFDDFFEFDWETEFSYQSNHFYINNFDDHENFNFDFNLPHLDQNNFEVDHKPLNVVLPKLGHSNDKEKKGIAESGFVEDSAKTGNWFVNKEEKWENQEPLTLPSSSGTSSSQNEGVSAAESGFVEASTNTEIGFVSFVKKEDEGENQELPLPLPSSSTNIIRKRPSALQFDDIRKHFDVPMNLAAKKMNVCVTILKKRCRELKITRWPHRKLRSLTVLINSLKDLDLVKEVAMLEKQKKLLEKFPEMELNEEIKKLREASFKAKYKKRRLITLSP